MLVLWRREGSRRPPSLLVPGDGPSGDAGHAATGHGALGALGPSGHLLHRGHREHPRWRLRAIAGFWLASLLLVAGFLLAPGTAAPRALFVVGQLLSVASFTIGIATARGVFRRDWTLMLVAVYVAVAGELLRAAGNPDGLRATGLHVGAVLSLVAAVLMMLGTARLARRDGLVPYASVGLDSAIYVLASALAWWILAFRELTLHPHLVTPAVVAAVLPPLGDAVMLVGAAALAASRTAHALSSRALVMFCVTGLVADLGHAHEALEVGHEPSRWVAAVWMLQMTLAATAALASGRSTTTTRSRMSLVSSVLVMASATAPALLGLWTAFAVGTARRPARASAAFGDTPVHLRTLVVIVGGTAVLAALVIGRQRRLVVHVEGQASRLEHMARTDELTQVANRRAGERILDGAVAADRAARAAREQAGDAPGPRTVHLAMLDLDHFKRFNDSYGHQRGDELLKGAAAAWSALLEGRGKIFRYGGEEFGVVLAGTTPDEARTIVADLQRATPLGQSFSAGLAGLRDGEDGHALVGRADAALYAAKEAGRARTVLAD